MQNPYLVGNLVYLRALERNDLQGNMFQWANDPEITKFMYMGTTPNTIEGLEREYNELRSVDFGNLLQAGSHPSAVVFAIVDREDDQHVGNVGFYGISWINGTAEVRIIMGEKSHWGAPTNEAYCLSLAYAFNRLNLRRISAGIRYDHIGAAIALKKVGFVQEGRQRRQMLQGRKTHDVLLFGLLREDFLALFPRSEI
jgi:[ribosomal protein S5]-alanine N-acetyltransferase